MKISYKCKCQKCGHEFATDKAQGNWVLVVCPVVGCRSNEIEFSDYSHSHHMHLMKV